MCFCAIQTHAHANGACHIGCGVSRVMRMIPVMRSDSDHRMTIRLTIKVASFFLPGNFVRAHECMGKSTYTTSAAYSLVVIGINLVHEPPAGSLRTHLRAVYNVVLECSERIPTLRSPSRLSGRRATSARAACGLGATAS